MLSALLWSLCAATPSVQRLSSPPTPWGQSTAGLGGGNVGTNGGTPSGETLAQLDALKVIGAGGTRTNLYPNAYIHNGNNWSHSTPQVMDDLMLAAATRGVVPILLFEYYAPQMLNASGFGSYNDWYGIGAAFASHVGPHGTWSTSPQAKAAGIPPDYGITWYTAINEPDLGEGFTKGQPGPAAYAAALAGLSAGVKSVLPTVGKVMPGGLATVNGFDDCTVRGLGAHLGPLWANGTLDGIDLHTYYDVQYAPMENTFKRSSQANYDCVLAAAGVTGKHVLFGTTEFNYKERLVNESDASRGFLTGIWDQFTVCSLDNVPQTVRAFPWNLFNLPANDPPYGMAKTLTPYVPTPRGCVYALVLALLRASDWTWESVDPRGTGVARLRGTDALLEVWQDRKAWTNASDPHTHIVANLPSGVTSIDVYAWDGLRATVPVPTGASSITVKALAGNETYMFLGRLPGASPLPSVTGCNGW
eukprot:m.189111 g.189111  ORF g.189111 m.189111 type:complete len:475 (-) comp17639_c0_seq1:53-1477(-)